MTQVTLPCDPRLVSALQALADAKRLSIVQALRSGERCVCELQVELDLAQPLLSHHLRILREAGIVDDRREGRWVYYSLLPDGLADVEALLGALRTDAVSAPTRTACCPP